MLCNTTNNQNIILPYFFVEQHLKEIFYAYGLSDAIFGTG
jgi:hypothetical protein